MEIGAEKQGPVQVVRLKGSLDGAGAPEVSQRLEGLLAGGQRYLLLNLAETVHLSSAGLRVILGAARKLAQAEGRLVLCSLSDSVAATLKMAGLDTVLDICPDEAAGRAEFGP